VGFSWYSAHTPEGYATFQQYVTSGAQTMKYVALDACAARLLMARDWVEDIMLMM
jgi:hypothetical protein